MIKIKINEPLSKYTSFGLGGVADVFMDCENLKDLKKILHMAERERLGVFILGAGTNLLVKDKGIRGLVVRLKGEFEKIKVSGNTLICGAGVRLNKVLNISLREGLNGLEFLAGIPGTVGGAVFMNAGIKEKEIKDVLNNVTVIDEKGHSRRIKRENIKFGYRESEFKFNNLIIIYVKFKLKKDKKDDVKNRIKIFLNKRKELQPLKGSSAGCVFKNPEGDGAGRIIQECKLKGVRIGKVRVSQKHANFLINEGNSSKDVIRLINKIKKVVKEKKGIKLEEEIIIVGEG
ncbi:MAG: UDP-N-acetylmuramate dehydrogenase [Candidatus Firestonebacteria bacterium]